MGIADVIRSIEHDALDNATKQQCEKWNSLTVNEAVAVVRDELLKRGKLYDGFLASVKSALIEYQEDRHVVLNASCDVLGKAILKRIVGE